MIKYYLALLSLFFLCFANAQERFASESLKKLFEALPIESRQNLPYSKECNVRGVQFPIRCQIDRGKMTTLGLKVFTDSTAKGINGSLATFIECELLRYLLSDANTRLIRQKEDKVFIYYGNVLQKNKLLDNSANLLSVTNYLSATYIHHDTKVYRIILRNTKNERLEIEFPKLCELILGMDKKELDDNLLQQLLQASDNKLTERNNLHSDSLLQRGDLYVKEGGNYLIKGFSGNTYYRKNSDSFLPVYQQQYVKESFANLFLTQLTDNHPVSMSIKIKSYGEDKAPINTSVMQFLSHFDASYQLYVGIEGFENDHIRGSLILYNPVLNFIHLIDMKTTPVNLFGNGQNQISAVMYPFIPCHNIRDLFSKEENGKSITIEDILLENDNEKK